MRNQNDKLNSDSFKKALNPKKKKNFVLNLCRKSYE